MRLQSTVFALTLGMTGGCRALLGIDEDIPLLEAGERGVGTEAGTPEAGGDANGTSDGAYDVGNDASVTVTVPADRRYAAWPLPPPAPLLSQYVLTTETVTDTITGLVWQREEPTPLMTSYSESVAFCKGFSGGGQTDWRLPTRIELLTILDYRQFYSLLNETVFPLREPSADNLKWWTASLSLLRAKLDDRYLVNVDSSHVDRSFGDDQRPARYRCVRGGALTSPVERYVIADGTARDVQTGRVWQITPLSTTLKLDQAKTACATLALGGFSTGWRLPNVRELASLVDEAREETPLLSSLFAAGPKPLFWSSTGRANPETANYALNFATADITTEDVTVESLSVRCVR